MKQPTADMPGSALGDAVGISWLLRGRRRSAGWSATAARPSASSPPSRWCRSATSASPSSPTPTAPAGELNHAVVRAALEHYAGVVETDPEPTSREQRCSCRIRRRVRHDRDGAAADADATAAWWPRPTAKPAFLAELGVIAEDFAQPPMPLGMVGDEGDWFVIADGPGKGMKGYFARDDEGGSAESTWADGSQRGSDPR